MVFANEWKYCAEAIAHILHTQLQKLSTNHNHLVNDNGLVFEYIFIYFTFPLICFGLGVLVECVH